MRLIKLFVCFFLVCGVILPSFSQDEILSELESIAIIEQKVMMPMRDGIRLCTDIYRPRTDKPVPIIFSKTPYNFNTWGDGSIRTRTLERALEVVKRGYAYVVQNERGRYFSEGSREEIPEYSKLHTIYLYLYTPFVS